MKVLASNPPSLIPPQWVGCDVSLQPCKWTSRLLTCPWLTRGGGGHCILWCLPRVEWLPSKSLLSCQAAPVLVLWLETTNLLWGFLLSICLVFAGFWPLQHRVWNTGGTERTQGAHPVHPWVLRLLVSSLWFSQSHVCFTSTSRGCGSQWQGQGAAALPHRPRSGGLAFVSRRCFLGVQDSVLTFFF